MANCPPLAVSWPPIALSCRSHGPQLPSPARGPSLVGPRKLASILETQWHNKTNMKGKTNSPFTGEGRGRKKTAQTPTAENPSIPNTMKCGVLIMRVLHSSILSRIHSPNKSWSVKQADNDAQWRGKRRSLRTKKISSDLHTRQMNIKHWETCPSPITKKGQKKKI